MWEKFPSLENKISKIIGDGATGLPDVISINIYSNLISIEICISDINPVGDKSDKIKKKNLVFFLFLCNYELKINKSGNDISKKIEFNSENDIFLHLGDYVYDIKSSKISFGKFTFVNDIGLVEGEGN